jgi:hypothetical protein
MRTKTNGVLGAAMVGVALAGCGGVHSSIPVDQTAKDLAEAVCSKAYGCCTTDQLMMNMDLTGSDEAECEQKSADNFRGILQEVQYSVDHNLARYQADKVDACLSTLRGSSCDELNMTNHLSGVPNCDGFTSPLVPVGGACDNDYQCIDGWCKAPPEGMSGASLCTAFASGDTSCADDKAARCASGFICDPGPDRCVHMGDVGDACDDIYQCKSLTCSSQGSGSQTTCQEPPPPQPMCFYQSGCDASGTRPGPGTIALPGAVRDHGRRQDAAGGPLSSPVAPRRR